MPDVLYEKIIEILDGDINIPLGIEKCNKINELLNLSSEKHPYRITEGIYILNFAAFCADYEMIKKLLEDGASPDVITEFYCNESPSLTIAIEYGRVDIVDLLLQYKADINLTNYYDETPLHVACLSSCESNVDIVNRLINNGANINQKDFQGNTSLHCAAGNACNEILDLLFINGGNINEQNNDGQTPLMIARDLWNDEGAERLISFGCDIGK